MSPSKTIDIWELVEFLRSRAAPISDSFNGIGFRAAVRLRDGLLLPCVTFRNPNSTVDLAVRRFDETRDSADNESPMSYRSIVTSFLGGNRVRESDISAIEESPFAIPESLLKRAMAKGETSMGFTSFVGEMKSGERFWFGTAWEIDFFEMPEGYTAADLVNVTSGESLDGRCYRERPSFQCFVQNL